MELINDKYVDYDIKASTRCKSGDESEGVHVKIFKVEMLKRKKWQLFFSNTLNKHDLIAQATSLQTQHVFHVEPT